MKLIHLSDLHLGKRVYGFSMVEDQEYILKQILSIVKEEAADGVMIAGDIYDKAIPSAEAVQMFDRFLTGLAGLEVPVFAVSGNHDSAERIAFGAQLMSSRNVYLSPVYDGTVRSISLEDTYGQVSIYLLPFLKPAVVRHALEQDRELLESEQKPMNLSGEAQGAKKVKAEDNGQRTAGEKASETASETAQNMPETEKNGIETEKVSSETEECASGTNADKIESYQDALAAAVQRISLDPSGRNVLIAHQFVAGASRCESEDVQVGGLDQIDAHLFDDFDYVALGHIHSPQHVTREEVRYCGTPLKYSFSEIGQKKSVTVVELEQKGEVKIREVPLTPLRDMCEIRGTYLEVTARSFYQDRNTEDYIHMILTDEEEIPAGLQKLRLIYPNLMHLEYDNRRTHENREISGTDPLEQKSELELFEDFYELQNNQAMSDQQREFVQKLIIRLQERM